MGDVDIFDSIFLIMSSLYCSLLTAASSQSKHGGRSRPTVLVIGAGVAGLAAARVLQAQSFKVSRHLSGHAQDYNVCEILEVPLNIVGNYYEIGVILSENIVRDGGLC